MSAIFCVTAEPFETSDKADAYCVGSFPIRSGAVYRIHAVLWAEPVKGALVRMTGWLEASCDNAAPVGVAACRLVFHATHPASGTGMMMGILRTPGEDSSTAHCALSFRVDSN